MSTYSPFDYPPDRGYADALVAYYAVFLIAQLGLGLFYCRGSQWSSFLGIYGFLILEILAGVAYLKLHFAPFLGSWYTLWIFGLTGAPTFLVIAFQFNIFQALKITQVTSESQPYRLSPILFIELALGFDLASLIMQIVSIALISEYSGQSASVMSAGFTVGATAMAIESAGLLLLIPVTLQLVLQSKPTQPHSLYEKDEEKIQGAASISDCHVDNLQKPQLFHAFLGILLTNIVLVLSRTIVRAVDLGGGVNGPLRQPPLVSAESLLLFVALLLYTVVPPAVAMRQARG